MDTNTYFHIGQLVGFTISLALIISIVGLAFTILSEFMKIIYGPFVAIGKIMCDLARKIDGTKEN